MHSIAREVEESAFSKRTIARSFENAGLLPFNPAKIASLARESLALGSKEKKPQRAKAMAKAANRILSGPEIKTTAARGRSIIAENKLFSLQKLLDRIDSAKQAKEEKKNERKRKKENEVAERRAKRLKQACVADSCKKGPRKSGDAKGWQKCEGCGSLLCKNHCSLADSHKRACSQLQNEQLIAGIGAAPAELQS